jgi:hypothetical protein
VASVGSILSFASAFSFRCTFALLSYRSMGGALAYRGRSRRSNVSR